MKRKYEEKLVGVDKKSTKIKKEHINKKNEVKINERKVKEHWWKFLWWLVQDYLKIREENKIKWKQGIMEKFKMKT